MTTYKLSLNDMEQKKCCQCDELTPTFYVFNSGDFYACSEWCRDYISKNIYFTDWDSLCVDYCENSDSFKTSEDFYYSEIN
jgi:hypothetical protein